MRAVNLLPAERSRKGGDNKKRRLSPVHGAALAILVGAGALGYWGHGIRGQVSEQKSQLTDLEAQSTKLQADIAAAKAKAGANVEQVSTFEIDRALVVGLTTSRVNWSAVMLNLSRIAPRGVWLESIAVTNPTAESAAATPGTPRPPAITLKARATTRTEAALFLSRLSGIPGFDQPRLSGGIDPASAEGASSEGSDGGFAFTVEIPVDGGLVPNKKTVAPATQVPATTTPQNP